MKALFTILLSAHLCLHAQDLALLHFDEPVIVWFEYETKRGPKYVEQYAGSFGENGYFFAYIDGPCELMVTTMRDDKDFYLRFPNGLNTGFTRIHRWQRGNWSIVFDEEVGVAVFQD